eukprot:261401_1
MQSPAVNFFGSGLDKLVQNLNLAPSITPNKDKLLVSYHKELNELFLDLQNIHNEYETLCQKICLTTNTSLNLSQIRNHFYSVYHEDDTNYNPYNNNNNCSYSLCEDNIAIEAINTYCIDKDSNSVLNSLNEWIICVKSLINDINKAQTIHNKIYENNQKLQELLTKQEQQTDSENIENEMKTNENLLSEITNIFQQKNKDKISNKINEILAFLFAMNDNFNKLKTYICDQYKKIFENKYEKMDIIVNEMVKKQNHFYNYCASQSKNNIQKEISQKKKKI